MRNGHVRHIKCIILASLGLALSATRGQDASSAERQPPVWKARIISTGASVLPEEKDDYFRATYGGPCDFSHVTAFGPGIQSKETKGTTLSFTSGKDALFFWGNLDGKHPEARTQKIGWNWPIDAWNSYWTVSFRIKQSVPESAWVFTCQGRGGKKQKTSFTVKGTEEQDVHVVILHNRTTRKGRWLAFGLETTTPGNTVEISDLGLYLLEREARFRTKVQLDSPPRRGSLTIMAEPAYQLHVNDRLVKDVDHSSYGGYFLTDITEYLRKGENILTVSLKSRPKQYVGYSPSIAVEGGVVCKDGSFMSIASDKTWKYSLDGKTWAAVKAPDRGEPRNLQTYRHDILPYYFGRMDVDFMERRSPIYGLDEGIHMRVAVPKSVDAELSYVLRDSFSGSAMEGVVPLNNTTDEDRIYEFRHKPEQMGVWELWLELRKDGQVIDQRYDEVAVIGRVEQREVPGDTFTQGMDLKPVDVIECGDPEDPHPFMDNGKKEDVSEIVDSPLGKYRQTPTNAEGRQWLSYAFKVRNLYTPHLITIAYPDTEKRDMGVRVGERIAWRAYSTPRSVYGVYLGGQYPVSGTVKKLYMLYWPNKEQATVEILNMAHDTRAAVQSITIEEITNDLPALRIANKQDRLFSEFSERDYLFNQNFYAGPDFEEFVQPSYRSWSSLRHRDVYKNWFLSLRNFIKYMRFTGMNAYMASIYSYGTAYFPSEHFGAMAGGGQNNHDHLDLVLKMFEYNDISLILGIESHSSVRLFEKDDTTDQDVARGERSIRLVSKDGRQIVYPIAAGGFNWFCPEVKKENTRIFEELLALYKDYPAFKGIYYHGWYGPGLIYGGSRELDWGYGDDTTALFQKDTGIHIPVPADAPDRFMQRYDWLMAHCRERWIDWRCTATAAQIKELARIMKQARPDLKLYKWFISPAGEQAVEWQQGKISFREAQRLHGHDLKLLADQDNVVCIRTGHECPERGKGGVRMNQLLLTSHEVDATFDMQRFGQCMNRSFPEPKLQAHRKWIWNSTPATFWGQIPPDDYLPQYYLTSMTLGVPELTYFRQADCNFLTGGEQGLRRFVSVYRTLPHGAYRTLWENGLDKNMTVRECRLAQTNYVYLLNPQDWGVDATLKFNKPTKITMLGSGETTEGSELTLKLKPRDGASFRYEGSDVTLIRGEAKMVGGAEARARLEEQLAVWNRTAEKIKAEIQPLPEQGRLLLAMIRQMNNAREDGDLKRAWELAFGPTAAGMMTEITAKQGRIPFALIGPFDNNEREPGTERVYPVEQDLLKGEAKPAYETTDGRTLSWLSTQTEYGHGCPGHMNLGGIFGNVDWAVAYLKTEVYSPEERDVKFLVGSDDGIKIWLNKKPILSREVFRGAAPGQDTADVHLKEGWNPIIVKAVEGTGAWRFYLEIAAPDGTPYFDLKFRAS